MRVAAVIGLAALALAGCGGGDNGETTAASPESPPATTSASGCESADAPAPKADGGQTQPAGSLSGKSYSLVVETNCGSFTIGLDLAIAPNTAASLVKLAEAGYFDGQTFHRIVPGFVIQGGDPTGTGTGGPGYQTVDVPPQTARYTKGIVAMAKSAAEAPGTSGSQFFVVTADDAMLPPEYAVVGKVTEGMDVVERIGALGDPATEQPLEPIVIERVTVETE